MLTINIFLIINSTMYNMQLYGNRWGDHQLLLKQDEDCECETKLN